MSPFGLLSQPPATEAPIPEDGGTPPFAARAAAIAARIRAQAVALPGGGVTWLAPAHSGERRTGVGPHLFGGSLGIAFFLAAADRAAGTAEHRPLVLAATAHLRALVAGLAADPAGAGRVPVGGMVGIGSWIYGLSRIGGWLDEPALVRAARDAARLLTPERIAADDQLDVARGCAGAILGLLALDEHAPEPGEDGRTPLDTALACAGHLLDRRAAHGGGPRAWFVGGQPPRCGFGHGASGIGHALLRLYGRTGDRRLLDGALEGFDAERALWDEGARNWFDPHLGRPLQLQSWCYGAPGVALARREALRHGDAPGVRADLDDALAVTLDWAHEPVDHLCCGNLGRAEALAVCAAERPALRSPAQSIALCALERAGADDGFGLAVPGQEAAHPLSLMRGIAGIGFVLLRLAHPGLPLPSPLCLD